MASPPRAPQGIATAKKNSASLCHNTVLYHTQFQVQAFLSQITPSLFNQLAQVMLELVFLLKVLLISILTIWHQLDAFTRIYITKIYKLQNALNLTAPASSVLLRDRRNSWVQLAGHPGSLAPAGPGTIWKKRGVEPVETQAYQSLIGDPARDITPTFFREVIYQDERILSYKKKIVSLLTRGLPSIHLSVSLSWKKISGISKN